MGRPTRQQTHIDRALTNLSTAYLLEDSMFIANKVFPSISVKSQSDTYFEYSREDFFRDEAKERSKGTESEGGGYDVSQADPYFCREYSFHKDVFEQDRANQDSPLNVDKDAMRFVLDKLRLKKETLWASKFFITSIWTNEVTGVNAGPGAGEVLKWTKSGSTPIQDVRAAKTTMARLTGKMPNKLVLSPEAFDALAEHSDILDRIKYTQTGIITAAIMAAVFDVEEILIPYAVVNTAKKGQSESNSFIYQNHALLVHVPSSPGLYTPSAGYTFSWTGYLGANAFGGRVRRISMPLLGEGAERIEGEMAFDLKLVAADLGYFFKDIAAA